ncbi:MAG: RNA polymerase sigma factor [Bacteroidota bacterium]
MAFETTQDLIQQAKLGSNAAQQAIYQNLSTPLMGVCLRYLKNREDAQDILLEAFLKIFKNLDNFSYESDAAFYGWAKRITINESLMLLRKNKDINFLSITEEFETEPDVSFLQELNTRHLLETIRQIPVGYRTVFNLYEIEGYSHQEIAEKLNISVGTSKSQLFKAKKLLREKLEQKQNGYA